MRSSSVQQGGILVGFDTKFLGENCVGQFPCRGLFVNNFSASSFILVQHTRNFIE